MSSSPSKTSFLLILCPFAIYVLSGQVVEGQGTVLQLLEGNATASPFDRDGTDFDIFSSLFTASSHGRRLEDDLSRDITVLAPDDNAFRRALGDLGLKTTSELETYENFLIYLMHAYRHPIDFLTRILYYHVVKGELNSTTTPGIASLATWDEPSTITREGNTLIDRNSPDLPNPTLDTTRMSIQASNGVIHVIDYVLFPEVMRKIKLPGMKKECSTPEPTLEETEYAGHVGSSLDEGVSEPTPTEEPSFQTDEPSQTPLSIPVGPTLLSDTGSSISQEPGPQEPTLPAMSSPLPSENFSRKESSPEFTSEPLEDLSDNSSTQKSSDVDISAPPFPPLENPGTEIPLTEETQGPASSVNPISPADETGPEDFSTLELPLGQVTFSNNPKSPEVVSEILESNESPTPIPFVGPIPEATSTSSPKIPGAVPEAVVGNRGPVPFPFLGPMPDATSSSSQMTPEPSLEPLLDNGGPKVLPLVSPASETSEQTEAETPTAMESEPSFPVEIDEVLEPSESIGAFSATPDAGVPETATTAKPDAFTLHHHDTDTGLHHT